MKPTDAPRPGEENDCPDHDTLQQFCTGGLADDQRKRIALHLKRCKICTQVYVDDRKLMDQLREAWQD